MNNDQKPKVVGIILAYKHARFLEGLYKSLPMDVIDEVIITNDDSGDNIDEIAERLGIPCFTHPRRGYGGNMKYGMQMAMERGADYMIEIHGDAQFDVAFIKPAVEKMRKGDYGLVLGTRFIDAWQPLRDKMPLIKYIANRALTFIESLVMGVWVSEFHTGARVYNKKAIQGVDMTHTSNNFLFGFEIIAQVAFKRFKIGEVPVRAYYGQDHTSINLRQSTFYAVGSFKVLFKYIIARCGIKTDIF